MTFKHDRVMPWILPGIQPTRVTVRVPQLAVVVIRADKVAFEHIWWDQASVLAQIGLLDDGGLPVLGEEEARKITASGRSRRLAAAGGASAGLAVRGSTRGCEPRVTGRRAR
jgi:carboxymethylenebutenolidase